MKDFFRPFSLVENLYLIRENNTFVNKHFIMEISDSLVDHIAHLAKLEFNTTEKVAIRQDMSKIVNFIAKPPSPTLPIPS